MITASQELMSSEKLTTFIEVSPRKKGDPPSPSKEEKIINNNNNDDGNLIRSERR